MNADGLWKALIQHLTHDEPEQRIPQKLQALIVDRGGARVGKRDAEKQGLILKIVI
jgi:hypothetical protein